MTWKSTQTGDVTGVADSVRSDIVRGRLRTGREIVVAELSEELGVSMIDVQQALLRLVDQHLVTASPEGLFHVVSTSRQDLHELTALRQLLEGEAVRLTALHGDGDWADRLRAAYRELEAAGALVDQPVLDEAWRGAHTAFHETLCSGCGNDRLLNVVGLLRDEAEIYRELSAAAMTLERRQVVDREHRELMELALAGRAEEAAATLRIHLEGTMRGVVGSSLVDGTE